MPNSWKKRVSKKSISRNERAGGSSRHRSSPSVRRWCMNPPNQSNALDPIQEGVDAYIEESFGSYVPRDDDFEAAECDYLQVPRATRTLGDYVIHRKLENFSGNVSVITEETGTTAHGIETDIESWEIVSDFSNDEDSQFSDFSMVDSVIEIASSRSSRI